MKLKSILCAALLAMLASGAANAEELKVYRSGWFLDVGSGIGITRANSLLYNDPFGVPFTTNRVSRSEVILSNVVDTHSSFAVTAAVGKFLTDNIYVKGVYRYFGHSGASGLGAFGPADFKQVQSSTANGAFLGFGIIYDLTDSFYLDASAEVGAAFIRSGGVHDANLFPQPFPKVLNTNFSAGAGLGLGYQVTRDLDLIVSGNYDYLGKTVTGTNCHCRPTAPSTLAEHLSSKPSVVSIRINFRFKI